MKKKNAPKNARRADGVLSPEELAKAIEEYKARRAQRLAAKADEDPTEGTDPVVSAKPTNAPAAAQDDDDTVVAPLSGASDRRREGGGRQGQPRPPRC